MSTIDLNSCVCACVVCVSMRSSALYVVLLNLINFSMWYCVVVLLMKQVSWLRVVNGDLVREWKEDDVS